MLNIEKKNLARLLFLLLLFCTVGVFGASASDNMQPAGLQASPSQAVDLGDFVPEISYGYGDSIKSNRFLPIRVELAAGQQPIEAQLRIEIKTDEGRNYTYVYPLQTRANLPFEQVYTVFLAAGTTDINTTIQLENATVLYTENRTLDDVKGNDKLIVGILSDTPENLWYMDGVSLNYGLVETDTVVLSPESFPKDSIRLQQLDVILISNFRIRDLGYEASMALMDWVKSGGIMILGTGERVDDTLGRYAPELLDDMYGEGYQKRINLRVSGKLDRYVNVYVLQLMIHGGNVILSEDDLSLLSSVNKEKGQILVSAYDFVELGPYMMPNDEYISNLLTKGIGISRLDSINGEFGEFPEDEYLQIKSVLEIPDLDKIPDISIYFIIIILYILLSGPVLFIFLRQRNHLELYKRGMAMVSISFVVLIYILGNISRQDSTFYQYARIQDVTESSIRQKIYVDVSNPQNSPFSIFVDNAYTYKGMSDPYQSADADSEKEILIQQGEESTKLRFLNNSAFETYTFRLEKKEENVQAAGVGGSIQIYKDAISGTLTNHYDFDLDDVSIFLYSKIVKIGKLKAGESIDLSSSKLLHIPLNNYFVVLSYLTSYYEGPALQAQSKDYTRTFERTTLMSFYMNNFFPGYSQDARILAFADSTEEHAQILEGIEGNGISLYVSNVSVDNRQGDRIYRQALMKNPTVVSGEYSVTANEFYTLSPLILEYNLGTDIEVEELIFEYTSKELMDVLPLDTFDGELYLYNHNTETYDKKYTAKTVYSKAELEPYLSADNSLIVRYSSENKEDYGMYMPLPMLSVIGKQK